MKVLLVQVRTDDMRAHEAECVRRRLADLPVEILPFDAYEKRLVQGDLEGVEAVIIGGSGEFCVSERKIPEVLDNVSNFLRQAREKNVPMLGICFGHQLMAEAFGGRVEMDVARQELGTYQISLTAAGRLDDLFKNLPGEFLAQEGHKDHVVELPPGAVHLAATEGSRYQAFTFPGEKIYGVQFHPELTKADVGVRLEYYRDLYLKNVGDLAPGQDPYAKVFSKTVETPEVSTVLSMFIRALILE